MISRCGGSEERGSATIWVLMAVSVLCVFGGVGAAVGAVALASGRARVAADVSALAGAAVLVRGEADPCVRAQSIAAANRAHLSRCVIDGSDLRVWISVSMPAALSGLGLGAATARARAGPVQRGEGVVASP